MRRADRRRPTAVRAMAVIALLATLMGAAAGIWMGREMARRRVMAQDEVRALA